MVKTEGQNTLNFLHALDFSKNAISKCKLRLFESLKQPHLKMKSIYGTRNTSSKWREIYIYPIYA